MQWPASHPVRRDPALAAVAAGAEELCPDARVEATLRHVSGQRVTTLVRVDDEPAVLKVFAGPRARGSDRALRVLGARGLTAMVPQARGVDGAGHVALLSYRQGEVLDQLPDDRFVVACAAVGRSLRRVHDSGAELERRWTRLDEVVQLGRRTPASMRAVVSSLVPLRGVSSLVDRAVRLWADGDDGPLVPSHRDCHPRQVICNGSSVAWIDLDDAAMAPAAVDVANMIAHLRREVVLDRRRDDIANAAIGAVLAGYRWPAARGTVLQRWVLLSMLRLAGLAECRHHAPGERDALLLEAGSLLRTAWRPPTGL